VRAATIGRGTLLLVFIKEGKSNDAGLEEGLTIYAEEQMSMDFLTDENL